MMRNLKFSHQANRTKVDKLLYYCCSGYYSYFPDLCPWVVPPITLTVWGQLFLKILGMIKATKLATKLSWQWVFYLIKTEGNHGSPHCQELSMLGPGISALCVLRDAQGIIQV